MTSLAPLLPWLWAIFTVIAAAAQVARNSMQRSLIERLGTVGATHVRFLYGFPFSLGFLAIVCTVTGRAVPALPPTFFTFVTFGALAQILATALMLAAMKERSFVVTIAITKTEPIVVALFGLAVLGDPMSPLGALAILIATIGVVLTAWKPGSASTATSPRPILLGVASATCFAIAAVGFRGAIRALPTDHFVLAATTTLVIGLGIQTLVLTAYLALRDRSALREIIRAWRPSMIAGFMGAFASQFWFLAFALESAAKVRTLALVEVLFAGLVSGAIFKQVLAPREGFAIALMIAGVALLLMAG